jgi:hypothetical protein
MVFPKDINRQLVYHAIERERLYQDSKWGGSEHDDTKDVRDWVAYVVNYLARTVNQDASWGNDIRVSRRYFIKVAALCVAAVEAIDRKLTYEEQNNVRKTF